jgi:hypothetical protein
MRKKIILFRQGGFRDTGFQPVDGEAASLCGIGISVHEPKFRS